MRDRIGAIYRLLRLFFALLWRRHWEPGIPEPYRIDDEVSLEELVAQMHGKTP